MVSKLKHIWEPRLWPLERVLHTTVDVATAFVVATQLRTDDSMSHQYKQVLYINDAMRPVLLITVSVQ